MKNIIFLIIAALTLIVGLFVLTPRPAAMQNERPKVMIEHISSSLMSNGSLTIYCKIINIDTVPVKDVSMDIYVLDSLGNVLASKKLIFFSQISLMPKQKALFTEAFENCWACEGVQVIPR